MGPKSSFRTALSWASCRSLLKVFSEYLFCVLRAEGETMPQSIQTSIQAHNSNILLNANLMMFSVAFCGKI